MEFREDDKTAVLFHYPESEWIRARRAFWFRMLIVFLVYALLALFIFGSKGDLVGLVMVLVVGLSAQLLVVLFENTGGYSVMWDKLRRTVLVKRKDFLDRTEHVEELGHISELELQENSLLGGDHSPAFWLLVTMGPGKSERYAFTHLLGCQTDREASKRAVRHFADAIGAKAYFKVLRGAYQFFGIGKDDDARREEISVV